MSETPREKPKEDRVSRPIPTVSAVLDSGGLLEMVYSPAEKRTGFVLYRDGAWTATAMHEISPEIRYVPYRAENNLLRHDVVLLPSEPEEYGSEEELLGEVRRFIHRYVDVTPFFEEISAYYVLLSWLYDRFKELPYLRVRGDYGSGKTRFLLTVGSLCYKPIFASGASTVSPIFRILDSFRGTLIVDEGDFRASDEKAEIVKILNQGNARGFPVLRSEAVDRKEFDPRAYTVFGPKIVATRGFFEDRALESRCLTEEMGHRKLREDVPISQPESLGDDALHLRNKLLLFRFRNLAAGHEIDPLPDGSLEPRLSQIFAPLLCVIRSPESRKKLLDFAREYNRELISDRGMDTEAELLEVVRDLMGASTDGRPSVKEITDLFATRHLNEYPKGITPRWIGSLLRRKLQLHPERRHGVYVLGPENAPLLERLYARYGLETEERAKPSGDSAGGTLGDMGDVRSPMSTEKASTEKQRAFHELPPSEAQATSPNITQSPPDGDI
jgi:hypothetical protein